MRVRGILDDASRYVIALEAHATEREIDMPGILVRSARRHSTPDSLYLDNGSTYRGDLLRLQGARLGATVLHARPDDPGLGPQGTECMSSAGHTSSRSAWLLWSGTTGGY